MPVVADVHSAASVAADAHCVESVGPAVQWQSLRALRPNDAQP
ncbi:hypothetical protein [Brachybacterium sacelli]